MARPSFRLYLITDRTQCDDLPQTVELALQHSQPGQVAIQLREKNLADRRLLELALQLREITRHYRATLLINDRVDIARLTEADGVHLGVRSLPARAVRERWPEAMIGVSCHNDTELAAAEGASADFVTFSPIFATPSKAIYGPPQGVAALRRVVVDCPLPVYALGGIDAAELPEIRHTGCHGAAMISGWIQHPSRVAELLSLLSD